jgi:hypothetical protein
VTMNRLDLLVLRLTVARAETRLRPNTGVEVRVIAGQLVELALAGALIDDEGNPAITSIEAPPGPLSALEPLRERVTELAGWRWDQLFWRQGIYAKAVLEYATKELIDSEVWVRTASARPLRPARYADIDSDTLREVATRLDEVITGQTPGTARERILVALNALLFDRRRHVDWMDVDWVAELPDLTLTERVTVQAIIEAANSIAAMMATGGSRDPVANGNY